MIQNVDLAITLTPELRLEQALKDAGVENVAAVTKLTVAGTLTKDDFRYMAKNMGKTLRELDMGDAMLEKNTIKAKTFFQPCGLTAITIPDSVDHIYLKAFTDCPELNSITMRPSSKHPKCTSENGILFSKDKTELLCCPSGRKGDYAIPDSVVKIGISAFSGCSGLTSITIPNSVKEIERDAFIFCSGLTSITIPDSVTSIDFFGVFARCFGLLSINVHPDNPNYTSEDGVLFNKNKTQLLAYPGGREGSYVIPNSVTTINWRAFDGCSKLTSITIPDLLEKIDDSFVFSNCENLASIQISKSLVDIEFLYHGSISAVTIHPDNPKFVCENGVVFNKDKTELLFYPRERLKDSQQKESGYTYTIPDSVIKIRHGAFDWWIQSRLKNIVIPKSVVSVGENHLVANQFDNYFVTVHPDNPFFASENGKIHEKS